MKKIIELHRFFVKESRKFVGTWSNGPYEKILHPFTVYYGRYVYSFSQKLYYPIAYIKFMWYNIGDVRRAAKQIKRQQQIP